MPAEQRVRRDDRRDLAQRLPTQPVGSRGKFPPVVIGEPQAPPTQLPPQHPILLDQVRQHLPLPAVQPAGDSKEQHVERRDVDHGRELTSQPRSRVATRSAEPWDTTRSRLVTPTIAKQIQIVLVVASLTGRKDGRTAISLSAARLLIGEV